MDANPLHIQGAGRPFHADSLRALMKLTIVRELGLGAFVGQVVPEVTGRLGVPEEREHALTLAVSAVPFMRLSPP